MSVARHHAEWLSLVPVSGPFLSMPVLMRVFNAGLDVHDPDVYAKVRAEHANWRSEIEKHKNDPAPHRQWIKSVLNAVLDLDQRCLLEGQAIPQTMQCPVPEHGEFLRPDYVVVDPATKTPRLLVQIYPRSQELTRYVASSHWKASPDTRMAELLHATGVRLGLVTNGEHWMLVNAPKGETTGFISWYAQTWLDERITLRAFRSLLSAHRFFGVDEKETLEAMLDESLKNQEDVTKSLGRQVRRAVEVLIHSLDRADRDDERKLLADVGAATLYESALTVMMRLVFLFCAEERELIPSKHFPVYEENYSVGLISKQLRERADRHGEELLEWQYDAWSRLLATFRAVFGGMRHDDVHIPAYGGNLFDPDRFPFLEGRDAGTTWQNEDIESHPLPVDNRTVLHLLEALQVLKVKVPGGGPAEARQLSFRSLDIEQIGHVYEGLLDHTAKIASEPFLGLIGKEDEEPEVTLAELETMKVKGELAFLTFLKEKTGKTENVLNRALDEPIHERLADKFRSACQNDESLWNRVKPFAGLVRMDSFERPMVIDTGSVFVTEGTDRRSSGTHYTPRSLTEPIVQYTLEPLVYVGPAEGLSKEQWKLKSAKELLELKICDMACGSGAFLVQAARYMSDRLMEAWDDVLRQTDDSAFPLITPEGTPSTGTPSETLIPEDLDERKIHAMRLIVQRCLYGVDKNPLAAEMAKLSLWLLTLAKDKPFEFLDHAIRCGDSLVGLHDIDQLKQFDLKPDPEGKKLLFQGPLDHDVKEAIALRLKLDGMTAETVEDVKEQEKLLREANEKMKRLRCAADLLVAAEFWGATATEKKERRKSFEAMAEKYVNAEETEQLEALAETERRGQLMLHWPLEFPEVVIAKGGFDAFVGNPPFLGGKRISTELGTTFERYLKHSFDRSKGAADLSAYFLRRCYSALHNKGYFGLLTTNSIIEGPTRVVGLAVLIDDGGKIYNARHSFRWPGTANVFASSICFSKQMGIRNLYLNEEPVEAISTRLDTLPESTPEKLPFHGILFSDGKNISGDGFRIDSGERDALIEKDSKSAQIIKPYLNSSLFNAMIDNVPERWAIDFGVMERQEAQSYTPAFKLVEERVKPYRDALTGQIHETRFWLYWDKREEFFQAISTKERVLVCPRVAKYLTFEFFPLDWVFSDALKVFDIQTYNLFAVLQSSFHLNWARQFSSSLKEDLRYSTSDAFETFPFPKSTDILEGPGESLCQTRLMVKNSLCLGFTDTYNQVHEHPEDQRSSVVNLRDLHAEMDKAVALAYGWDDLDLEHGFHETKQGLRFTISEAARREVLQRLLKLNHERYAEEVAQGLHGKKTAKKKATKKAAKRSTKKEAAPPEPTLFNEDEE